jgi:hypothetical protein
MVCLWSPLAFAQTNVLSVAPPEKLIVKAGAAASAKLTVQLRPGYHCNSNKPSEDYLIPLKLTWGIQQGTSGPPIEVADVTYPQPRLETYSFSKQPLSVYTGDFEIVTKFKVPASAPVGTLVLSAKLHYQACNDRMCLQPKTVDISLPVDIVK